MERSQAKFFKHDVLNAFMHLEKPISRGELVSITGLGEGSIRSILDILKTRGLIESSKKGHFATRRGSLLLKKLNSALMITKEPALKFPKANQVLSFIVRNPVNPKPSYLLRDIAVKWGAAGALIFSYNRRKLVLPPSTIVDYEEDYSSLEKNLCDGDWLALIWGDFRPNLISGGLEIASELSLVVSGLLGSIE